MTLERREGKIGSPDCADDQEGGKGKLFYLTALVIKKKGGRESWPTQLCRFPIVKKYYDFGDTIS